MLLARGRLRESDNPAEYIHETRGRYSACIERDIRSPGRRFIKRRRLFSHFRRRFKKAEAVETASHPIPEGTGGYVYFIAQTKHYVYHTVIR